MKDEKPVGFYFKIISNNFEHHKNKQLEEFNLTSAQANVLAFLKSSKQVVNQREIENKFNLSNPTVNGILNRLETKGLITRVKNVNDARIREIHLTDKASDIHKEMIKKMDLTEKEILSVLSRDEQKELYKLLKQIAINIKR